MKMRKLSVTIEIEYWPYEGNAVVEDVIGAVKDLDARLEGFSIEPKIEFDEDNVWDMKIEELVEAFLFAHQVDPLMEPEEYIKETEVQMGLIDPKIVDRFYGLVNNLEI